MTTMDELPKELRTFVKMYAWKTIDPVPWAPMTKPLKDARVGLVVMACMTAPDQPPFEAKEPDFDPSMRVFSRDTKPQQLVNTYPEQAFDHSVLKEDPNILIPLDRLHQMHKNGEIGEVSPHVVSLCGHLPKPQVLIEDTAPDIATLFRNDNADVVLLVPAWPLCNQTGSLVAAEIEHQGIPTVMQIYLRELALKIRPPRSLYVPFQHGHALGEPNDVHLQMSVLRQTFQLLDEPGPPPVLKEFVRGAVHAGA